MERAGVNPLLGNRNPVKLARAVVTKKREVKMLRRFEVRNP
jgi:hypothetical protein